MNDDCTGTFLPGNLFLTAAHCVRANPGVFQMVNGVLESVAVPYVSDRIAESAIYLNSISLDLDGDYRTTGDQRTYRPTSGYSIMHMPGPSGLIERWDMALLKIDAPVGESPDEILAANNVPRHRVLTSTLDNAVPYRVGATFVHAAFDVIGVMNGHNQAAISQAGWGDNDVVLNDAGAILPDASTAPNTGPRIFRFATTGTIYQTERWAMEPGGAVDDPMRIHDMFVTNPSTLPYVIGGDSGGPLFFSLAPYHASGEEVIVGTTATAPSVPQRGNASYSATFSERGRWLERVARSALFDIDRDGVPNEVDNCPLTANSDQANCNFEVESLQSKSVLGDACDPVPCPGAAVNTVNDPSSTAVCSPNNRFAGSICIGTQIRSGISYKTVGSHPVPGANTPPPADVPAGGYPLAAVDTDFRFCAASEDYPCTDATKSTRFWVGSLEPGNGAGSGIWRRMSFTTPSTARGAAIPLDYGTGAGTLSWDFAADANYWASGPRPWTEPTNRGGCIPVAPTATHPDGICLNGYVWALAGTLKGATESTLDFVAGPGIPSQTVEVGLHADDISASLFQVNPSADGRRHTPGVGWIEKFRRPVILTLPDPPWWPTSGLLQPYKRNEAAILTAVGGALHFVHPNGDVQSAGSAVSGDLYALLDEFGTMSETAPTQRWLDLADPRTRDDRPLNVVARKQANGSWRFDSVVNYYGGMILESEYGNPLRYGSVASLPSTPIVYSPQDDALWTAGTNTLSRHAAGATSFVNVLPAVVDSIKPANVKALAFDAERQVAWIVDYTNAGIPRLLRFAKNPAGVWVGAILGQGAAAGSTTDVHYLHLTLDGRVIYARSNVAANTRVLSRFTYDGALSVEALTGSPATVSAGLVDGALVARPLLDGTGYHQMVAGQDSPVSMAAARGRSGASSARSG